MLFLLLNSQLIRSLSLWVLMKNDSWEHFMRLRSKKFAVPLSFLTRFRCIPSLPDEVKIKIPILLTLWIHVFLSNLLQATALQYFKRFYLQWSVMQHHPKEIMYSSSDSSKLCTSFTNLLSHKKMCESVYQFELSILCFW